MSRHTCWNYLSDIASRWSVSVDRDAKDHPEQWTKLGGWHDNCMYTIFFRDSV